MAKRTDFQKAAVEVIDNKVHPDTRRCRADGTIEVKRSYFYRHGSTADGFAARVRDELTKAGLAAVVTGEDRWATWPRTSWFVAIVEDAARTEASIPEMRETIREMMDDFDRAKAGL